MIDRLKFPRRNESPPPRERGPHPSDLDLIPSNQPPSPTPERRALNAALADPMMDEADIPGRQKLREIVTSIEFGPTQGLNTLDPALKMVREHLQECRDRIIAAIDEYEGKCERARELIDDMMTDAATIIKEFKSSMNPKVVNPETAPPANYSNQYLFNHDGSLREVGPALDTDNDCAP